MGTDRASGGAGETGNADWEWRIAPTRRPAQRVVMRQRWERLLFLHWEVPAAALSPLLPPGLVLDTYEGRAFVGLVPFTMKGVRPVYLPAVPGLSNFHETNIRTYVHIAGRDPGVWFFSLDAANSFAVRLARAWFKLPYHFARMAMQDAPPRPEEAAELGGAGVTEVTDYRSERLWPPPVPARLRVRYAPLGAPAAARPGTLEHFLAERYVLYAYKDQTLYQGRVHHTPYPLQSARVLDLEEDLIAAAGIPRAAAPPIAHYASSVSVEVFPLHRQHGSEWGR